MYFRMELVYVQFYFFVHFYFFSFHAKAVYFTGELHFEKALAISGNISARSQSINCFATFADSLSDSSLSWPSSTAKCIMAATAHLGCFVRWLFRQFRVCSTKHIEFCTLSLSPMEYPLMRVGVGTLRK